MVHSVGGVRLKNGGRMAGGRFRPPLTMFILPTCILKALNKVAVTLLNGKLAKANRQEGTAEAPCRLSAHRWSSVGVGRPMSMIVLLLNLTAELCAFCCRLERTQLKC